MAYGIHPLPCLSFTIRFININIKLVARRTIMHVRFYYCINVLFLVASSAAVGHTCLEFPRLEAWMDTWLFEEKYGFCFWINVHPPGRGTGQCSYPASQGMAEILPVDASLIGFRYSHDPHHSCSEVFWWLFFWLFFLLLHLREIFKKV